MRCLGVNLGYWFGPISKWNVVVENEKENDDNWSPQICGLHAIRKRINIFVH